MLQPVMQNHEMINGPTNIELSQYNFGRTTYFRPTGATPIKTPKLNSELDLQDSLNIRKALISTY